MQQLALIALCLLLQACSSTNLGLTTSLWHSLVGKQGVHLTDDEMANMPYASQYVTFNGGPQLFVALAFSENGQQKWVTQDRATLVTEHGRLVKTVGLPDNLIEVNNLDVDPLAQPNRISDGATWSRQIGWTENQQVRYATARSTFTWVGNDTLQLGSTTTHVRILDEEITADGKTWHNRYGVDSDGQIRQSLQSIGPGFYPITTLLIKAAKS